MRAALSDLYSPDRCSSDRHPFESSAVPTRRGALKGVATAALGGAAAFVAGAAQAQTSAPTQTAGGDAIIGAVPSGQTRLWQLGAQKSFDTLELVERPIPTPRRGEALIKVETISIAARDQGIATGMFPVPPGPRPATMIPLSDGAGTILALGPGESRLKPGDRVMSCHWANWVAGPWTPEYYSADIGNTIDGWLGEYVLLPTSALAVLPPEISTRDAATLSGSASTAWHALHEVARVRSNDTVLTLGTGGVSSFGLLFAKAAGARVVVTSSSDEKLAEMRKLGADLTVNYRSNPDWGKEVYEKTQGRVSVVLENVGPGTLDQSMAAAGNNARIVMIGTGRPPPNPPNIYGLYLKNLSLKAISNASRSMIEDMLRAMVNTGVRPIISKEIPFAQARKAYEELRDGDHIGKVVITL
jgi:NADPH:quinone reductase-like Zn-dependent oxidoreductase